MSKDNFPDYEMAEINDLNAVAALLEEMQRQYELTAQDNKRIHEAILLIDSLPEVKKNK